ncbi:MAG: cytochrome-c peroxidase [Luminiphilus sp.]|jgi:cytochrome c peroxidase|nr:cytochrome-c peroxidase [Luminiphilus sp.]
MLQLGALLLLLLLGGPLWASDANEHFELSTHCPPALRLDESGRCRLYSQYLNYRSLYDRGVGGLRTGLPAVRDGFTPAQIDLGRYLFFDPLLSGNSDIACSSCHDPALGFSDGLAQSIGATGEPIKRSAPSLWNVAFLEKLLWDGSKRSLEEQMLGPLYADDEMAGSPESLVQKLSENDHYPALFAEAYDGDEGKGHREGEITLDRIYTALVAFESSLISLNSRYDLYAHGVHSALTEPEIEGLNVFRSFVARCAECHTPPLFTNQQIAVLGVPEKMGRPLDPGAAATSGDPSQRAGFRVPSLRNVVLTKPYMHAGNFDTLRETVAFYTGGRGHAVPEGEDLKLHWHIWDPQLTDQELDRVVDFLGALTDQSFMPEIPVTLPSGLAPGRAADSTISETGSALAVMATARDDD